MMCRREMGRCRNITRDIFYSGVEQFFLFTNKNAIKEILDVFRSRAKSGICYVVV